MATYTSEKILRIAKRFNNQKRTYLFVNPLQAKHIPVSPRDSLGMMKALGYMLANKYPHTKLVIGFAETATAIGAVVAESLSPKCVYIHTTREDVSGVVQWVRFKEEHSHATEQNLAGDNLSAWISATDSVIFVDDEISTGKTMRNMIEQLKQKYPHLKNKRLVAASLLNRVAKEDEEKLASTGIVCEYLLKLPQADYPSAVKNVSIHEAPVAVPIKIATRYQALFCENFGDPRKGIQISRYKHNCDEMAETFVMQFFDKIKNGSSILILGTEECMYPALKLGAALEDCGQNYCVSCHATTRSPIGVCADENYPITSGYKIKSFYDFDRATYIYNLCKYDVVVVVTDTSVRDFVALESLIGALPNNKSLQIFYIQGGKNVWYAKAIESIPI